MNKLEKRYLSFRRGNFMRKMSIEERAVKLAHYIIETEDTVRGAAKKFRY